MEDYQYAVAYSTPRVTKMSCVGGAVCTATGTALEQTRDFLHQTGVYVILGRYCESLVSLKIQPNLLGILCGTENQVPMWKS